jgi:hypothetical protein
MIIVYKINQLFFLDEQKFVSDWYTLLRRETVRYDYPPMVF